MKPVILVLTSTYPRWQGDTEPGFVQELCKRLVDGYQVHVVTSHFKGALPYENVEGVCVHRFRYAPPALERLVYPGGMLTNARLHPWVLLLLPMFFVAQLIVTWKLARKHHVALIHAHWVVPQGLAALLLRPFISKTAFVVTSHGADVYGLRGKLFGFLKAKVWGAADAITVVSHAMAEAVSGSLDSRRLAIAPMGVDLQNTFVVKEDLESRKDLIFVGRLVEKKGVDVLLRAFAALLPGYPDLRLTIVGDGPYGQGLQALAATLSIKDAVRFVGAVPNADIPVFLNRHAVAVVPSVVAASGDQEGLGLVSIEAMGCGCTVVASDLPAIRDVVEGEKTGLVFDPGNAVELAARLGRLLEDDALRIRLSEAGRRSALQRFDWSIAAENYRRIYARLV